jgi:hypothetical protein
LIKISKDEDGSEKLTLKVEGRVIGAWTNELQRVWADLLPSIGTKRLCIDICGVTYLDDQARKLLREIFQTTRAEILADSPLTKQFADEATT